VRLAALFRPVSIHVGLAALVRIYLIGSFIGNFLPGTVGGDVVKYTFVRRHARRRLDVIVAILAERSAGFLAVLLVATAGALWYRGTIVSVPVLVVLLATDGAVLLGLAVALGLQPREREGVKPPVKLLARLAELAWEAHAALHTIARDARAAVYSLTLSLLFVCHVVAGTYVFAWGLGLSLGVGQLATITALVQLATMVPVSFNGVGIREWSFVLLLSPLGVSSEAAVSVSLMIYISVLVASLPGAFLLIHDRGLRVQTGGSPPSSPSTRSRMK
jgi:uncharacterized membrane protein YbhN (UPF0104 family)